MYSPEQIDAMTSPYAQFNFAALAADWYGHDRWKAQLASDIGLTAQGVKNWYRVDGKPPVWAFLLVSAWIEGRRVSGALKSIRDGLEVANSLTG